MCNHGRSSQRVQKGDKKYRGEADLVHHQILQAPPGRLSNHSVHARYCMPCRLRSGGLCLSRLRYPGAAVLSSLASCRRNAATLTARRTGSLRGQGASCRHHQSDSRRPRKIWNWLPPHRRARLAALTQPFAPKANPPFVGRLLRR